MTATKTLAYYGTELITVFIASTRCFRKTFPECSFPKSTILIYLLTELFEEVEDSEINL